MHLRNKYLGRTWVGWLNTLLFQWFFFRLEVSVDNQLDMNMEAFNIIYWIVPLTGWTDPYKTIGPLHRKMIYSFYM